MSAIEDDRRLAEAGVGLGELTIQWGRRPDVVASCQLMRRDLRLLAFLHDFAYATTSVLALLFWGRYCTAARERLKVLHDAGFVDKLRPRVSRSDGSREWIYRLTIEGWEATLEAGMAADGEDYTPAQLTSITYVEHDVQVAALVTRLALLAARKWGRSGPLIDAAPFELLGPRAGAIDPEAEQCPSGASAASDLGERVVHHERAIPGLLKPDATLLGITRDGDRMAVMIEYDRTRRASKQLTRLRHYDYFLTAGWRESRYATLDIEPALLLVCADARQIPSFVRVADTELTAWSGMRDADRMRSEHTGREQVGITSRAQLLAGDWQLVQVPHLPPALRRTAPGERVTIDAREETLGLDDLFRPVAGLRLSRDTLRH